MAQVSQGSEPPRLIPEAGQSLNNITQYHEAFARAKAGKYSVKCGVGSSWSRDYNVTIPEYSLKSSNQLVKIYIISNLKPGNSESEEIVKNIYKTIVRFLSLNIDSQQITQKLLSW